METINENKIISVDNNLMVNPKLMLEIFRREIEDRTVNFSGVGIIHSGDLLDFLALWLENPPKMEELKLFQYFSVSINNENGR